MTIKRESFLPFFIFLLIFLSSNFALAAERALEVVYPEIPGVTTPETVATGLPTYVNYIFRLAVIIIGLIIFGVLIYNGIIYLTSAGNPSKLSDAKSGILAGFLGGIILLSAFLIFNTINPQLTILEIEKMPPLRPIVFPGIYICSYKVDEINDILQKYFFGNDDERVEAVKKLKEKMASDGKACLKLNYSGNFKDFTVKKDKNTFFIIPAEEPTYDFQTKETKIKYVSEYGLVLHEKDNFGGKCQILLFQDSQIYQKKDKEEYVPTIGTFNQLEFEARSFTLFKKPASEPSSDDRGIILYNCYTYDQTGCAKDVTLKEASFNTGGADMRQVWKSELGELAKNTRSVKIEPKGSFLALLYEEDNFKGKCEVISSNVVDLTQHPIGRCGSCIIAWYSYLNPFNWFGECNPCIQSMIVVKGQAL